MTRYLLDTALPTLQLLCLALDRSCGATRCDFSAGFSTLSCLLWGVSIRSSGKNLPQYDAGPRGKGMVALLDCPAGSSSTSMAIRIAVEYAPCLELEMSEMTELYVC